MALYRNDGTGLFNDYAPASGSDKCPHVLTFATFFFDYDLDSLLDIFAAKGQVSATSPSSAEREVRAITAPFRNKGRKKIRGGCGQTRARAADAPPSGAARPTATRTTTAISICSSPSTTAPASAPHDNANQNDVIASHHRNESNRDGIGAKLI